MFDKNITFDVVIPLYNGEKTILSTLESIENQTFQPCHIIVVNDGSTDRSFDIVQMMQVRNKKLVVVNSQNSGRSAARNKGISMSDSDYVAFLDADDWWEPDRLDLARRAILKTDAKAYASGYKIVRNGKIYHGRSNRPRAKISLKNLVTQIAFIPGSASSAIVSRDLLTESSLFSIERSFGEDLEAWCKIAAQTNWILDPSESVIIKERSSKEYKYPESVYVSQVATLEKFPQFKGRISGWNSLLYARWIDLRRGAIPMLKKQNLTGSIPNLRSTSKILVFLLQMAKNLLTISCGSLIYISYSIIYGRVRSEKIFSKR